ncbi:MAG: hypothetical protein ACTHU0_18960 [Kofleriaceae bacterium]
MSLIRYVFLASLAAGCSTSELDGPLDFERTGGFGGKDIHLHLEVDGSYSTQSPQGPLSSGVLARAELGDLRDAIAAADLGSIHPRVFACGDFPCGADADTQKLQVHVSGEVIELTVDRNIPNDQLPSDLVRVLDLLAEISVRN